MTSESLEHRVKRHDTTRDRSRNTRKNVLTRYASAITPALHREQKTELTFVFTTQRNAVPYIYVKVYNRCSYLWKFHIYPAVGVAVYFQFHGFPFFNTFDLISHTHINHRGGDGGAQDVPLCDEKWLGGGGGQRGAAAGMSGGLAGRGADRIPHAKSAWPRGTHHPHLWQSSSG